MKDQITVPVSFLKVLIDTHISSQDASTVAVSLMKLCRDHGCDPRVTGRIADIANTVMHDRVPNFVDHRGRVSCL